MCPYYQPVMSMLFSFFYCFTSSWPLYEEPFFSFWLFYFLMNLPWGTIFLFFPVLLPHEPLMSNYFSLFGCFTSSWTSHEELFFSFWLFYFLMNLPWGTIFLFFPVLLPHDHFMRNLFSFLSYFTSSWTPLE